jgi:hypothetical protein
MIVDVFEDGVVGSDGVNGMFRVDGSMDVSSRFRFLILTPLYSSGTCCKACDCPVDEGSFVAVWWLGDRLLIKMTDHVRGDWLLLLGHLVAAFCFLDDLCDGFETLASGLVHTWITLGGAVLDAIVDGFVDVFLGGLS